ncbi:MAG: glutamine--fructose-6-phosphate transaminase (isomerizing) [Bacteroidota bacterium]|nr:glutamine--fructose-6-phosphate transaminase (isomerizing) [Bacteroidota bacterium]
MCGIVGYLGKNNAFPYLIDGLRHLEYRGYDSAGVTVVAKRSLCSRKTVGKVEVLAEAAEDLRDCGTVGIAHTRWATHGEPSVPNAHPHFDCTESIAVVHNGIIENYSQLKKRLADKHRFLSETDTEVIAHLVEEYLIADGSLESAVQQALADLQGTYALAVIFAYEPETIIAARQGSPLVIGIGEEEYFVASDVAAFLKHTHNVLHLSDGEICVLTPDGARVTDFDNRPVLRDIMPLAIEQEELGKNGFPHFMLKEIFEQPKTIEKALCERLDEGEGTASFSALHDLFPRILESRRITIVACGTSWHAGLVGEYMLEQYAHIPVDVEYASEFRYRDPLLGPGDVVIGISQSGETADTLAAIREARCKGAAVIGICNVPGSSMAQACDATLAMNAGPEIGVASTKAYIAQLVVLLLLALALARKRTMNREEGQWLIRELSLLPGKVEHILADDAAVLKIAEEFHASQHFLYLGRGFNFPNALEGALKLKEISYIHAEGYPAAEMKHGPIALIDANMPVVFLAPRDHTYEKILSNIQEVKARKGKIITVTDEGNHGVDELSDHVIRIPQTIEPLTPLLTIIPLQLLAYHIALLRGCNVDQPRNLAKSVTVE